MKIKPTSEKAKSASKVSSRSHLGDTSCVPELRFPHFTTPWETTPLSRLLRFQNGVNAPAEKYGRGVKFVSVSDIIQNDYVTYDNIVGCVDIDDATLERYSVENGDMVFQRSSETVEDIGRANVYLDNRTATFGGFVIRGKKIGEYNPYFFKCLLYSNEARRKVIRAGAGAQHYNIGQEALSQIYLHFPEMAEQRRIADLLLLVSNRIDAQRKLVELLKKHKRGLSNALFSGKVRMARNAKWKTYRLGDIVRRVTRKNGKVSDVPLTISAQYGLIDQREFFSKAVASADMSGYYLLKQGEFAYNRSSSGEYPFGSIKRLERYNQGAVSTLYICFEVLGDKDDAEFLKWYFDSFAWHREVGMICAEGARNHGLLNVPTDGFFDTKHKLPTDKNERKKIATLMALADARCEHAETELNRLTTLKSGLLQQLFV